MKETVVGRAIPASPSTDRDLGIAHEPDTKFRDVRHRAGEAFRNLHRSKKPKQKQQFPVHPPGATIVASTDDGGRKYILVDIVDFDAERRNKYYGIVKKASFDCDRIGRIVTVEESFGWFWGWKLENLSSVDVIWK